MLSFSNMNSQSQIEFTNSRVIQSSNNISINSRKAIDREVDFANTTKTLSIQNSWWQIQLDELVEASQLDIFLPSSNNGVYVLFSEENFISEGSNSEFSNLKLQKLLTEYFYVALPAGREEYTIALSNIKTKYVTIVNSSFGSLEIVEVILYGRGDVGGGSDNPFDNYEYGEVECGDNLDNDDDDAKDCEDSKCNVGYVNITFLEPSCPICHDGEICIQASNTSNQISLDGGVTWLNFIPSELNCYEVGEGVFDIVLESKFGCTENYMVELATPRGVSPEDCMNGSFEEGTFDYWTGGIGVNNDSELIIDNTTIDNDQYQIIATNGFIDEFIPAINGDLDQLGIYFAKLGDTEVGVEYGEATRLTYCFEVTPENELFYFYYALVLEDPNHSLEEIPFFQWKFIDRNTGFIISENKILSDDPFLFDGPEREFLEDIKYKTWTCVSEDLSSYLGQQICVEFNNADCAEGGHWSYTYIDGLCGDALLPNPIIETNEVICNDQQYEISVTGSAFQEYNIDITVQDQNGMDIFEFIGPVISGTSVLIDDIKVYLSSLGFQLECDHTILFGFTAYNDCTSHRVETTILSSCNNYIVNYCSPLYYCGGNNLGELQIAGVVDCVGCTYDWSGTGNGLIGSTDKFPIISRELFTDAFLQTYFVEVTTPDGCIYNDEVTIQIAPQVEVSYFIEECDIYSNITVVATNMDSQYEIYLDDNLNGESFLMEFNAEQSDDITHVYSVQIERNLDRDLVIDVTNINGLSQYSECFYEENFVCTMEFEIGFIPRSVWTFPWRIYYPEIFNPNSPNPDNSEYYVYNAILEIPDQNNICDLTYDPITSSIYHFEMLIFDRWDDLVFHDSISVDPTISNNGVDVSEIRWDGTFNDELVVSGVYACEVIIHSCYTGPDIDEVCDLGVGELTGNEEITILAFDITVGN